MSQFMSGGQDFLLAYDITETYYFNNIIPQLKEEFHFSDTMAMAFVADFDSISISRGSKRLKTRSQKFVNLLNYFIYPISHPNKWSSVLFNIFTE